MGVWRYFIGFGGIFTVFGGFFTGGIPTGFSSIIIDFGGDFAGFRCILLYWSYLLSWLYWILG